MSGIAFKYVFILQLSLDNSASEEEDKNSFRYYDWHGVNYRNRIYYLNTHHESKILKQNLDCNECMNTVPNSFFPIDHEPLGAYGRG